MSSKLIANMSLLLFYLSAATAYAINKDEIPCPDVKIVQQSAQKIDTADIFFFGDYFNIYTATSSSPVFYENNRSWSIMIFGVAAKSSDQAISTGKWYTQKISVQKHPYAVNASCDYGWVERDSRTPAYVSMSLNTF